METVKIQANLGSYAIKKGKIIPCASCGNEIYRRLSRTSKNNYCSRDCRYKNKHKIVQCVVCGNKFQRALSRIEYKNNYCSANCYNKSREGVIVRCSSCGEITSHRSPSEIKDKNYCSNKCHGIPRQGKMPAVIMRNGKFGHVARGTFNINGREIFLRSKWEANYALYLDWLKNQKQIKEWGYEQDVFIFEKIKTGTRSYRPDFKIINNDNTFEYHEIKGWETPKSKTQINRMRIYYPKIKLLIVRKKEYIEIKDKLGKMLSFY